MLLSLCLWLTGRPGWGCVLYFVVKLLLVVALDSFQGVCFQKVLPLCAPVRRLSPQKTRCCGWWWQLEEGVDQSPEKRRVPRKTPGFSVELAAVVRGWVVFLEQRGAPGLGAASSCAVIAGESVSCVWGWLSPCAKMFLDLSVWNSGYTLSVALVLSYDKWDGAMARHTRSTSWHFLMGFHVPRMFSWPLS